MVIIFNFENLAISKKVKSFLSLIQYQLLKAQKENKQICGKRIIINLKSKSTTGQKIHVYMYIFSKRL